MITILSTSPYRFLPKVQKSDNDHPCAAMKVRVVTNRELKMLRGFRFPMKSLLRGLKKHRVAFICLCYYNLRSANIDLLNNIDINTLFPNNRVKISSTTTVILLPMQSSSKPYYSPTLFLFSPIRINKLCYV